MRVPHRVRHGSWLARQWLLTQAKGLHAVPPFRARDGQKASVCVYPALRDVAEVSDLLHKLKYYCDPRTISSVDLCLHCDVPFDIADPASWPVPDYADSVSSDDVVPVNITRRARGIWQMLARYDYVLVWEWPFADHPQPVAEASEKLFNVDRHHHQSEGWAWAEFAYRTGHDAAREQRAQLSRDAFKVHIDALPSYEKAYVFGTGPSLDAAMDLDFSDGYRIVCNTIVENHSLVKHIDPHIIVAGDAVYHYAPNLHATAFRKDLEKALPGSNMLFVTRDLYYPLLERHHPAIASRTVTAESGVPGIHMNAPERIVYHQWPMGNILNALMLPLASSLADDIHLLGFDGRAPGDSFFWKTASKSSYDALKPPMRDAHPGFFAIDYEAYADAHSQFADELMAAGEAQGKRYTCINRSYIPAFQSRMIADPVEV